MSDARWLLAPAKWLIGLNGAGYLAAITAMGASYVTLAGNCESFHFVSEALVSLAKLAALCGIEVVFAAFAAALPSLVGFCRNRRNVFRLLRPPPIAPGKELAGLSEGQAEWVIAVQAAVLVVPIASFLIVAADPIYGAFHNASPSQLGSMLDRIKQACPSEVGAV